MGINDLDRITGKEINKSVSENLDFLYKEYEPFRYWWDNISRVDEKRIEKELFNLMNRRFNKHKFKDDKH